LSGSGKFLEDTGGGVLTFASVTGSGTGFCADCVFNDSAATDSTNTIKPTTNATSLSLWQTSASSPTKNIFGIFDSTGTTTYATLASDATWTLNSAASKAFSLQQGGSNFLSINTSGAISLSSLGTNQNLTLASSGSGVVNINNGDLQTGSTTRLTNAGALNNITGYTQTSGTSSTTSAATSGSVLSITDNSLNTTSANLANLTFKNNSGSGTITVNGLSITPTGNATSGANTLNSINLPNVTTVAGNTFNAFNIGSGYDNLIKSANFTVTGAGALNATTGTFSGASSLTLGTGSANTGSAVFNNATNSNTVTIQSGVATSSYSLTLPTALAGAGTFLKDNGSGALTFATLSGSGGSFCSDCVLNDTAVTDGSNTIAPTNDVTSLTLRQTSVGSPTKNIFAITNSGNTVTYASLNSSGVWSLASASGQNITENAAGTGAFSLQQGGSNFVNLNSSGALAISSLGTNQNITIAPSGTGAVNINSGATSGNAVALTADSIAGGTGLSVSSAGTITGNLVNFTANSLATGTGELMSLNGLTTGKGISLTTTSTTLTSGVLENIDHSATYSSNTTDSGNLIKLNRGLTSSGSGHTLTLSGAMLNVASQCLTVSSGVCTDTANLIALNQSNTGATGDVLNISNSATNANSLGISDTALTGSASLANFTFKNNNSTNTGITINGVTINENAAAAFTNQALDGINTSNLINLVANANGTVNGLNFGSNFTNLLTSANTTISGSGALSTVEGTFGTANPVQTFGTTGNSTAFSNSVSSGNFLIATVYVFSGTFTSVSDNQNGTWTKVTGSDFTDPNGDAVATYYMLNAKSGSTTVSVNGTTGSVWAAVGEFSGIDNSNPIDQVAFSDPNTNGTTASVSTAAATTAGDAGWGMTVWYPSHPATNSTSGSNWVSNNFGSYANYQYNVSTTKAVQTMSTSSSLSEKYASEIVTLNKIGNSLLAYGGNASGNTFGVTNTAFTANNSNLANLNFTNNNTGAGVSVNGLSITNNAAASASSGTNTSNLINLTSNSGGTVNGINFSGTNFTNLISSSNLTVNNSGDLLSGFTSLAGSTTTNGAGASSTSMVLTSASGFSVGNYIKLVNPTSNCTASIKTCYAKITAIASNTLTISPALTWDTAAAVTQWHVPEIGGNDASSPTLTSRYGTGYFINGIVSGNGSTFYTDQAITQADASSSFSLLNNGNTSTLNIGSSGTTVNISGNLKLNTSTGLGLGVAGSNTGSLIFDNSSNTNTITMQAGTTSSSYTLTLPVTAGSNGQILTTNGSGTLSWGSTCPSCVLDDSNVTDTSNTIAPTTDATALTIRQTSAGSPTKNIFAITNSANSINYAVLASDATWTINSASAKAFNLQQGGTNFLSTSTAGAITLASTVSGQNITIQPAGTGVINLTSASTIGNGASLTANSLTTGTALNLSTNATTLTSAVLQQLTDNGTYTTAQTVSGNLLNLNRSLTINASSTTLGITGALASLTSNCTQTSGTCTDSSNVLALTQSFASATGAVLSLTNSGSGSGISVTQSTNPASGQALVFANNTAGSPSGNLIDLQNGGTSRFNVDFNGTETITGNYSQLANTNFTASAKATCSSCSGNNPLGVSVSGRYAFVANNNSKTIQAVDVSVPASPASISTVSTGSDGPNSVNVQGRYAYVTVGGSTNQLQIYDISNPASMVRVGSASAGGGSSVNYVYPSGHYAYVLSRGSPDNIQIFDVSNPSSPSLQGSLSSGSGTGAYSIYVQGRYLYKANFTDNTVQVIDVGNPNAPSSVGTSATTGLSGPRQIIVQGRYGYVVNGTPSSNQFVVFDLSNPASPTKVGQVATGSGTPDPRTEFVSGRYVYVLNFAASTFQIIDVSSPTAPTQVYTSPPATSGGPFGIFVSGHHAYTLGNTSGVLQIWDISGIETTSALIHSLEAGSAQIDSNAIINNQLAVGGGIDVGNGGIFSAGGVGISGTSPNLAGLLDINPQAITSNNELISLRSNTYTQTISANITNDRFNQFLAPTIAGSAATKTVTNAATLYIDQAPIAGTNAAITNDYALWVNSGGANFASSGDTINFASTTSDNTFVWKFPSKSSGTCSMGAAEGVIIKNTSGTQKGHLCIDSNGLNAYAFAWVAAATDLAENFSDSANYLTPGDVVAIDPQTKKGVLKSSKAYDSTLLGVISTNPGVKLSGIDEQGNTDLVNPKPVALSGRVPVKFSSENGSIKPGDYLTSATNKPGYAMKATKAGRVIGLALSSSSTDGVATVFINAGFFDPGTTTYQSNGVPSGSQGSSQDPTFNSVSAKVGSFQTLNLGSVKITTDSGGNLKVNGNLVVTSSVTVSKDLTLYGALAAPNGLAVNLGDGKSFAVNASGQTSLSANSSGVSVNNLSVAQDANNPTNNSAGSATMTAGQKKLTINTNQAKPNSHVIVTFGGDYSPATRYWVDGIIDGHSFNLNLDQATATATTLNWWIVN
jgi:hypothetical protein